MRVVRNEAPNGFGFAVRKGLEAFRGDAVVIVMADGSDDPRDVVLYYRVLEAGYDCAFGSRFMPGAPVHDYPKLKLLMNRIVNTGIRALFRHTSGRRGPWPRARPSSRLRDATHGQVSRRLHRRLDRR